MATNWITLSAGDLIKVISTQLREKSDENIGDDVAPNQAFDPDMPNRADEIIKLVIAQFRGAIQVAGKYPLSVTPDAVPPEVVKHVLNMAAFELVNSTQTLQMVILTEKGAYSPFQSFYKAAQDYLDALTKGRNIVFPTDPTGEDYIRPADDNELNEDGTANEDYNPSLAPVRVGATSANEDLTTFSSGNADDFPSGQLGQA